MKTKIIIKIIIKYAQGTYSLTLVCPSLILLFLPRGIVDVLMWDVATEHFLIGQEAFAGAHRESNFELC